MYRNPYPRLCRKMLLRFSERLLDGLNRPFLPVSTTT